MEINSQRYELAQNGRKYILTTEIHGDYVRLTCVETGVNNPLIYLGEFSLVQLRQFCSVFNSMTVITQAQELLNKTIESQKVSVEPRGNFLNIILYLTSESEEEDSFSLKMGLNNPQNLNYNQPVVYPPVTQESSTTVTDQYITSSTNQDFGNTVYPSSLPVNINANIPSFENTTTTTTTEQVYSTPLENTTTTTINDAYSIPVENTTTTTTTNEMYSFPIENTTTTTTNDLYTVPIENTTSTTTTNDLYSIPIENTTTTTTTNDLYSIPIENTTTTTTNEIYSTPIINTTTTTTTNDILTTATDANYQNFDNTQYQNIQSYDNVQNYENLNMNGGNQIQTDVYKTTTTKKINAVALPLAPSANEVPQTNNQDLNNYFTNYQNQREQIHYEFPDNSSNGQFTYSTTPLQQKKVVETTTTTTTTKDYQPYPNQNINTFPTPDVSMYTEKITQLQTETTKIKNDNDLLRNENNRLNGELAQLRNQIQILSEENRSLREKNGAKPSETQIHEITILRQENEQLRKQLEQYLNLQNTFEQYKRLKEDEISLLKLKIQELINNQKKLEEFILQKQKEIEDLKLQIQQLIKNVNVSESQYIMRQQQQNTSGAGRAGSMDHHTLTIQDTRLEVVKGDIINSTEELEFLTRKICKNHKKITLDLLYKATIDGDKAEAFHNKCDWANSTLVLVKSGNGKRFGGFTTCNWKGNSIEKKDENAFVFSLDKMQIYDIIPGEDAIGCYQKYGPVFLGCQIRIYDDFFTKGGTTFEKGLNYNTQEDFELTGGLNKFDVEEIEVYSVDLE